MKVPVRLKRLVRSARRALPPGLVRLGLRFAPRGEHALVERFNRLAREHQFGENMGEDHAWFTARLLDHMQPHAGRRVLEVGCGNGWASRMGSLRVPEGRFTGIDIADAALRSADTAAWGRVALAQASAETLPFRPATFDAVFCIESLFLFPSMERALGEMKRVLVPGGRVYLVQCLFRENRGAVGWIHHLDAPVHVKGAGDYRDLLSRCGWSDAEAVELRRDPEPGQPPNSHDHALLLTARKG